MPRSLRGSLLKADARSSSYTWSFGAPCPSTIRRGRTMKSPFPGMDPYLEDPAFWSDFHLTFIGCWREAIADVLPDPYEARLDETVHLVQMPEEVIKLIYPD